MPKKIFNIDFQLLDGATEPTRGTDHSAGWDLYSRFTYRLRPNDMALVDTGLIAKAPPGHHFKIVVRSGLAIQKGLTLVNSVGIIDEDYFGPTDVIYVPLIKLPILRECVGPEKPKGIAINVAHESFKTAGKGGGKELVSNYYLRRLNDSFTVIKKGERVAQLLVEKTPDVKWIFSDNQITEDRGGFGSTGEL